MPLDPQAQAFIDQMAALNTPPINMLTPEVVRQWMKTPMGSLSSRNRWLMLRTGALLFQMEV